MSAVSTVSHGALALPQFGAMREYVREFIARHTFTREQRTARLIDCTPIAVLGAARAR